jgi:hypothetical protein
MSLTHSPIFRTLEHLGRGILTLALSLLILGSLLPLPVQAGAWKGQEVEEGGVKVMLNPDKGMESAKTVELEELWRIGGDTDDEDEFFGLIAAINADDDGNIYVLDLQLAEVKVYDPDGVYLRSLGREGEGPGEFRFPSGMFFLPDGNLGVVQTAPGRIAGLTLDGDPLSDYPIPSREDGSTTILRTGRGVGDNLYLMLQFNQFLQDEGKFHQTVQLVRADTEGNILAEFTSSKNTLDFANAVFAEKDWDNFVNRWDLGADGQVIVAETYGEYEVSVWNNQGEKEMIIKREMDHRKREQSEIDRLECIFGAFTRQVPDAKIVIGENDQDIFRVYGRNDGSIWVNTSHGSSEDLPEGVAGMFDVFDSKGRFVREVTLKGQGDPRADAYFFVGDRFYVVTGMLDAAMALQGGGGDCDPEAEEEPEPMAVICYRLNI